MWPFDLRTLTFWFHPDKYWRERFPHLEWPMATCNRNTTTKAKLQWESPASMCAADECDHWRAPPARTSAVLMLPDISLVPEIGLQQLHMTTAGAYWPMQPTSSSYPARLRWSAVTSHGWVEVVREPSGLEGESGHGCWLTPVVGSGIWFNVGQSWAVATKPELYLPWVAGDVVGAWLSRFGLGAERVVADEHDFEAGMRLCEAHAAEAHAWRCKGEWLIRLNSSVSWTHGARAAGSSRPLGSRRPSSGAAGGSGGVAQARLGAVHLRQRGGELEAAALHAARREFEASGPLIGVVGDSRSPRNVWNLLRYRLSRAAMCRLNTECNARPAAISDATGRPAATGDASRASFGAPKDAHWLGYPEAFPFMAYELGLTSVQIGPTGGGTFGGGTEAGGRARKAFKLPSAGTPGWRAEIVVTTATCMGPPVHTHGHPLGWRTCLSGIVDVHAGPEGSRTSCSCDEAERMLNCHGARCRAYCRLPASAPESRRQLLCSRADCVGCSYCQASTRDSASEAVPGLPARPRLR